MFYIHFKEELHISIIRTETKKVKFKDRKRSNQIKTIEMGSQIRRQGQLHLLNAILIEAFPYFQRFRILANAENFCKTLF